jgi:DNA-binding transcriptional MocR family regulator
MIDLGCAALGAPEQLSGAVAAAVEDLPAYTVGAGYHPSGLPALRERVARTFTERGLPTDPDQIMITCGVQQAVDLVLRLLAAPGQTVLVESPTYPNVLAALRAHRTRITTTNLDPATGWDEDMVLAEVRASRPTLAYVIPEFQNPTGHVMPASLRERLPAAAHRAGTDLIVDESFVDLPFDNDAVGVASEGAERSAARGASGVASGGAERSAARGASGAAPGGAEQSARESTLLPVAAFDAHARVLTVGGMSKPYWGGLRVGWIRAAVPVIARLSAMRVAVDMAGPVLDQLVAAHLLDRRAEVIPARRAQLRARRDALATLLNAHLPGWSFKLPRGGVSLWVELDAPVSTALAQAALEHGLRLAPGPSFGVAGTLERFVRLPFTLSEMDLAEAVRRLAAASKDLARARPAQWSPPSLVA